MGFAGGHTATRSSHNAIRRAANHAMAKRATVGRQTDAAHLRQARTKESHIPGRIAIIDFDKALGIRQLIAIADGSAVEIHINTNTPDAFIDLAIEASSYAGKGHRFSTTAMTPGPDQVSALKKELKSLQNAHQEKLNTHRADPEAVWNDRVALINEQAQPIHDSKFPYQKYRLPRGIEFYCKPDGNHWIMVMRFPNPKPPFGFIEYPLELTQEPARAEMAFITSLSSVNGVPHFTQPQAPIDAMKAADKKNNTASPATTPAQPEGELLPAQRRRVASADPIVEIPNVPNLKTRSGMTRLA